MIPPGEEAAIGSHHSLGALVDDATVEGQFKRKSVFVPAATEHMHWFHKIYQMCSMPRSCTTDTKKVGSKTANIIFWVLGGKKENPE